MEKTYAPHDIEQRWYENWETNQYFAPSGTGEPYCIMIPPQTSQAVCTWDMRFKIRLWMH